MRPWLILCSVAASAVVCCSACGGRVVQGPTGGGSPDGGRLDGGGMSEDETSSDARAEDESCAALADCCGEFSGATAASCNATVNASDDAKCADQVTALQGQGACRGQ